MKPVYDFIDYKYLIHRIRSSDRRGHGLRHQLALFVGCQTAYISQVLNGSRHLSLEQAEAVGRYFALSEVENEYFIWLVQFARSGTKESQEFFRKLIERKRVDESKMKSRVQIDTELNDLDKSTYYSDFHYSAVHMMVTIEKFQSETEIARHLNLSMKRMHQIVDFLISKELLSREKGRLVAGVKHIFLDRHSPFVVQHHLNYRLRAMRSVQELNEQDVHLSMVFSLSEADARKLKQYVSTFVSEFSTVVKASKEEMLMVLNLDFFAS